MEVNSPLPDNGKSVVRGVSAHVTPTTSSDALMAKSSNDLRPLEIGVEMTNIASNCSLSTTSKPGPKELTVIPARRTIFISRFSPDITVEDINFYISSRVENMSSLSCFKMKSAFSERLSSFKIVVPENLFSQMLDANFWPANALVKEFVNRGNERRYNLASLPKPQLSASKN